MNRRVVITGVGLVTPLGVGTQETWTALCEGKSGIAEITRFDAAGYKTRIAGEVKGFRAEDFLPKKDAKRAEPFISYSVAAARMALDDSGFVIDSSNADRVGVIAGCGLGGLDMVENSTNLIRDKGPGRVSPFLIPMLIGNMAPGMISIQLGAKGPNFSVSSACAAGAHAISESCRLIQNGDADAVIAGGVEAVIAPTCVAGFNAMKALSTRNDEPQKASRPFDRDRDGFVVGEGSGMMILETLESAIERGATIYAEICGVGMNADAYHITAPSPEGEGTAKCMRAALKDAGISGDKIDYINAHGTSTPLNDSSEVMAVKSVFGESAYKLAMSSTKSMTGHLLGGAGGIETAFTALSVFHGIMPPTINLDNPQEGLDLDFVPNVARKAEIEYAMTNSFGFGGTNASLILKKIQESV